MSFFLFSPFSDVLKTLVFGTEAGQLRGVVGQMLRAGLTALSQKHLDGWAAFADWAYDVSNDALDALK